MPDFDTCAAPILPKPQQLADDVTKLNAIAAPATIGLSRRPNHRYRTPAAIGTPAALNTNEKNKARRMFFVVARLSFRP